MIYCVEDDDSIREMMLYALRASNLECVGFPDGETLFAAMKERPDLILLDIMLPGMDGIEILKRLQRDSRPVPAILASARGAEYDKVLGLDLGADDYLAKPFGMMEMVSRVRAVLRRYGVKGGQILRLGGLAMDIAAHKVRVEDSTVELTLKEFALLRLFMENPGKVFTRDQLLSQIWNMDYVGESRTVDVHVGTLRTKLGNCGSYITTVRGVGYRMEEAR